MASDPLSDVKKRIKATEDEIDDFADSLQTFLRKNLNRILKDIRDGKVSANIAAQALGSLQTELEAAGLTDRVASLRDIYAKEIVGVKQYFKDIGINQALTGGDLDTVSTLISFDSDKITSKLSLFTDDVKGVLMRSVLGGEPFDVTEFVEDKTGVLANQLNAEVNTQLATFSRTITANKAQELGFELMIYLGPDDKITRDFCKDLLDKDPPIYTIEEINKMDNGQGLSVLTSGGGYNCRHQWRPISEERAREMGWQPDGD